MSPRRSCSKFLVLLAICSVSTFAAQPPPRKSPDGRLRLALLIGINQYKYPVSFENLRGAVNDVLRFKTILTTRYSFPAENVLVLTDAQATRDGILEAFRRHLIRNASTGDKVIFYYAGHGSRTPNRARPSGFEETIVPHDSRDPDNNVFDITDTTLRELFGELRAKTSEITAIMDSCHSGTAIRGNRRRAIPPDRRPQPLRNTRNVTASSSSSADRGIVFIAGARSDQSAFEHLTASGESGAMSYFLARELARARDSATWRDVMDRVRAMVTVRYPEQEPQLEGSAADKVVFGERSETTQPYYLTSSGLGDVLKLNGGRLHDLSPGSRLDVYSPGTKDFNARAKPLAKVEVTAADTFTSEAKVIKGGPVPEGSRAVERERNFGSFRFRVFMHPELPADTLKSLRRTLSKHQHIEFVSSDSDCDLQVAKEGSNLITLGCRRNAALAAGKQRRTGAGQHAGAPDYQLGQMVSACGDRQSCYRRRCVRRAKGRESEARRPYPARR